MKGLFLILFLLSQCANAWHSSTCSGSKKQRKEALIDLVHLAQSYKLSHNRIPDPMSDYNEEFMNLIPKVLNGSLIHVGIQDVDIEYQSVSYACKLKSKKDITETCSYRLKTKKVHCYELKPPQFNYGVKGSEAIKKWGHLQEAGWAVMPNISNLPSTKDQGVRDLEKPSRYLK